MKTTVPSASRPRSVRAARAALAACCLAAVLAVAPGTAPQAVAQSDLSRELEILKRDLKDLQRYVYRGESGGQPPASESSGNADDATAESMPSDVAGRLQVKMQRLETEMRRLTGRIEETEFRIRQVGQRLDRLASDLEFRLQQLESGGGRQVSEASDAPQALGPQQQAANASGASDADDGNAADSTAEEPQSTTVISSAGTTQETGPSDAAGAGAGAGESDTGVGGQTLGTLRTNSSGEVVGAEINQDAVDTRTASAPSANDGADGGSADESSPDASAEPQAQAAPEAGSASADEPDRTASTTALPDGTPKEQYEFAFDLLRKRDYAAAESAMRRFVDANGEHALAGNAMYWLGETYYARENYRDAAATFLDAYTGYPQNDKASHSLLKLGMSLGALGKKDAACQAFATLRRESDAASRVLDTAAREAEALGCS